MHIHDLAAASALAHKLECAKDALKRTNNLDPIIKAHQAADVQVSMSLPVPLDDGSSYAVMQFPVQADMIEPAVAAFRAKLKLDIAQMEAELREIGVTAIGVN